MPSAAWHTSSSMLGMKGGVEAEGSGTRGGSLLLALQLHAGGQKEDCGKIHLCASAWVPGSAAAFHSMHVAAWLMPSLSPIVHSIAQFPSKNTVANHCQMVVKY